MKNILEDETKFEEFLNLYKRYFQGRKDVVARYRESNQFRGYTPICNNSLKKGLCRIRDKVKKPCNDCPNKIHTPLDDILLSNHIFGNHILGIYPLLQDNTCWFVAADFDDHDGKRDPLADVKEFYEVCSANKIPCYVLRSKSGKGYHVYLFFDKPVPAWKARVVALSFLKDAGVTQKNEQLTSFDRLFPNQNKLSGLGLGNLIAYPFQGKAAEKDNTLFLNHETNFEKSFSDQLEVLRNISTLSESDLDRFIDERGLWEEKVSSKKIELSPMNHSCGSSGDADKVLKCDFIRYCQENQAEVTEPQWLAMISNVSRISPGGLDLCHEYSKKYPGYSRRETEEKIRHAMNGSAPITCKHIKETLFDCGKDCGVTSPTNLLFQKSSVKNLPNLVEAKISLKNIIELSSREPEKFVLEVLQNPEYVGSLALVAEQDVLEYETTLKKMEINGVKVKDIASLKRAINSKRAEFRGIHLAELGEEPTLVKLDVIPSVPVTDNILIPKGWNLSLNEGLVKSSWSKDSGYQQITVAPTPIIIVGRMFNVGTGNESIKLSWFRDGKWKTQIVERGIIATKRSITSLANLGVPVTDSNAALLIEFLSEFEAQNIGSLPLAQVSNILGWQKNGQGFLWGKTHFQLGDGVIGSIDLDSMAPENWQKEFITFKGDDEGDQQIADGFVSNGEYELWIQAVNKLFPYPFAISGVYFSLLPPFLEILGADNFTVDWANRSSVGKTTILRVAGSCWGDPDEKHPASVVQSWDATKVWIEKAAAMLNGLPLILDDTKLAGTGKNKEFAAAEISQVLYQIAQGRGRGRGSVNGTRSTGSWRTILLSTGEQSAVDFTGDGGSRGRVISFWGLPFEKADESTVSTVQEINLAVKENYGHAGPKVIEFLLKNQGQWAVWKSEYQRMRTKFTLMAGNDSVAIRISDNFAFLATVIPIIHAALPELKQVISPMQIIQPLWDAAIRDIKEADRATVALQTVYDWAVANQTSFWGRHQGLVGELRIPAHGWAGAWNSKDWNYIAYIEEKLHEILKAGGFDTEAIIKTWLDRDWLQTDKTGRRKHVRINGPRAYCYCIKKSVLDRILKLKLDDDNDE